MGSFFNSIFGGGGLFGGYRHLGSVPFDQYQTMQQQELLLARQAQHHKRQQMQSYTNWWTGPSTTSDNYSSTGTWGTTVRLTTEGEGVSYSPPKQIPLPRVKASGPLDWLDTEINGVCALGRKAMAA